MKFLFGSQNFGLDIPNSDKDYVRIIYPKLEDLCKPIPSSKERKQEDGSVIKEIDIRAIPELFYKSNLDILQLLYSKEVVDGGEIYYSFKEYESELSRINIPRMYQSVIGSAINRFKRETNKDLAHIIFGFNVLIKFHENNFQDFKDVFVHDDNDFYRSVRNGDYSEYYKLAKHLEGKARNLKEDYMKNKPDDKFKTEFQRESSRMLIKHLSE